MSVPFTFSEPYQILSDTLVDIHNGDKTWTFTSELEQDLPKIYNMDIRKDDVWLLGYPKSGNTWASEMIYTIYHGGTKEALELHHFDRWCLPDTGAYERSGVNKFPAEYVKNHKFQEFLKNTMERESPRFIRTHLPLSLLPPKLLDTCKVVYICRNFKDTMISAYKMTQDAAIIDAPSLDAFLDYAMSGSGLFNPFAEFIKEAWEQRHHPNMYFLFYEEMKKDLPGVMRKMAAFLGKSLTDEVIEELQEHLSVESMRNNKNINMEELKSMGLLGQNTTFIRKGISGDWKNYLTPSMLEKFEKWMSEQMAGSDFKFME